MTTTLDHARVTASGGLEAFGGHTREPAPEPYPYSACPCGVAADGDPAECVCRHPASNYPPT